MQQHQRQAKDIWGYAEFLPCSLETPEFMAEHHRRVFDRVPGASEAEWRSVIRIYNEIGTIRRNQFLRTDRHWRVNTFMLVSDIEKIVMRTGEYEGINRRLVTKCMENLTALIEDPTMRLNFVLAEEDEIQGLLPFLKDCDTRLLFGESLCLWRDHRGNITWSEHPRIVYQQKELFGTLFRKARFKKAAEVVAKLKAMQRLM
jgi:hypothetical protein